MPPWLLIWIARYSSGERFRKSTPVERRYYLGFFFLMPIFMALGVHFGHSYLDRAGAIAIWFWLTISLIVFLVITFLWAKFVPAVISLILGIIVWAVGFWLAWHEKL